METADDLLMQRIRRWARSAFTAGLVTLSALVAMPSAEAAIQWYAKECSGFAACNAKGLGNAGYEKEYRTSHWGMYAGHNCTNYAAYRLIAAGIDASYLQGRGMAYRWGTVAASEGVQVDRKPRVGDIAWWSATGGMSSSGHVAYVEKVDLAKGRVLVSEDNWSSDFDWRYYNIADVTGFIHFGVDTSRPPSPPAAPAPAGVPASSTVARLTVPGLVTTATPSATIRWSGASAYQVQRRSVTVSARGSRVYSAASTWITRTTAGSSTFTGSAGSAHQFRVRAVESTGATGPWSSWQTLNLPQDDAAASTAGVWRSARSQSHYASTYRYTTRAGASATWTGWADEVAVIGPRATATSRFTLYVDGINRGTVDTSRSSTAYRQVLATVTLPFGRHTVRLVNQATTGRPYLYADAVSFRR